MGPLASKPYPEAVRVSPSALLGTDDVACANLPPLARPPSSRQSEILLPDFWKCKRNFTTAKCIRNLAQHPPPQRVQGGPAFARLALRLCRISITVPSMILVASMSPCWAPKDSIEHSDVSQTVVPWPPESRPDDFWYNMVEWTKTFKLGCVIQKQIWLQPRDFIASAKMVTAFSTFSRQSRRRSKRS